MWCCFSNPWRKIWGKCLRLDWVPPTWMQNSHVCLWACYPIFAWLNSSSLCVSLSLFPLLLCIHLFPLDYPLAAAQALRRDHQRSSPQKAKEAGAKEGRGPERETRRWEPEERPEHCYQVSFFFLFLPLTLLISLCLRKVPFQRSECN